MSSKFSRLKRCIVEALISGVSNGRTQSSRSVAYDTRSDKNLPRQAELSLYSCFILKRQVNIMSQIYSETSVHLKTDVDDAVHLPICTKHKHNLTATVSIVNSSCWQYKINLLK